MRESAHCTVNPGCEQGRRGIVARRGGGDLVESGGAQSMFDKPVVKRGQPQRQRRPARGLSPGELGAERSKLFGARPIGQGGICGYRSSTTHLFPLCSDESTVSSRTMIPRSVARTDQVGRSKLTLAFRVPDCDAELSSIALGSIAAKRQERPIIDRGDPGARPQLDQSRPDPVEARRD